MVNGGRGYMVWKGNGDFDAYVYCPDCGNME
jgi:hypothetical protein